VTNPTPNPWLLSTGAAALQAAAILAFEAIQPSVASIACLCHVLGIGLAHATAAKAEALVGLASLLCHSLVQFSCAYVGSLEVGSVPVGAAGGVAGSSAGLAIALLIWVMTAPGRSEEPNHALVRVS